MITYLFVFGAVFAWNQMVGDNEDGTWLARVDGGFRMSIYGQFLGGISGFGVIVLVNFALKEKSYVKLKQHTNVYNSCLHVKFISN